MSGFKYVEDPILGKGRAEFIGGGTGGETYNFNTNEFNVSSDNDVSLKAVPESKVPDFYRGRKDLYDNLKNARFFSGNVGTPLTILHMSDVHADSAAFTRILADATYLGNNVDEMICTGDMRLNVGGEIASWWNEAVLTCVGNHDSATQSGTTYNWTGVSMADRDTYYIAPFEANWDITHTSGTSYYYKDYATQKVRLIVMDGMLYMSNSTATEAATQTAWLESLLADAVTNELHVLIAIHAPHGGSTPVSCSFTKYGQGTMGTNTDCNTPQTIIDAVATKITAGLHFVGYLCGHTHQDAVWDATGDGTQYMYCVTTANVAYKPQWQGVDLARSTSLDAFNLVSIDTVHSLVKIVRGGGANIDNLERAREGITIDYSNGVVIDRERSSFAQSAGTAGSATIADSATVAFGAASSMAGYRMEVEGGTMSMARFVPIETVTGASVTLMAGYAYRIQTSGTAVTLNTENIPANSWGLDGHIDIFTTSSDLVVAGENVRFNDSFSLNAWNSCTVRFASGIATVYVDNRVSTYIVIQNTDLTTGSLYFGLTDSSVSTRNYINIDASLDGQTLSLSGATVTSEKHILGNGVTSTTLAGSVGVGAGGYLDMTDCALSAVTFTQGMVGLGTVDIPTGATVSVTSGGIAVGGAVTGSGSIALASGTLLDMTGNAESVPVQVPVTFASGGATVYPANGSASSFIIGNATALLGNTNTFDLHQGTLAFIGGSHAYISGCTCTGGNGNYGAFCQVTSNTSATFSRCVISGNVAKTATGALQTYGNGAKFFIFDCILVSNSSPNAQGAIYNGANGSFYISGCVISGNVAAGGPGSIGNGGKMDLIDTEICSNTGSYGGAFGLLGGSANITGCYIHDNSDGTGACYMNQNAKVTITGCTIAKGQRFNLSAANNSATFVGSNIIGQTVYGSGHVYVSSGAIIDLTGNTNATVMNPAGGIVVSTGGCTVIAYDGTTVSVPAGTYASIKNDGSTT